MDKPILKLVSILLIGVFTMVLNGCSTPKEMEKSIPIAGYKLVWHDEFEGSQIDTTQWTFRTDVKHRSVQLRENVTLKGGILKLNLHQLTTPCKENWRRVRVLFQKNNSNTATTKSNHVWAIK